MTPLRFLAPENFTDAAGPRPRIGDDVGVRFTVGVSIRAVCLRALRRAAVAPSRIFEMCDKFKVFESNTVMRAAKVIPLPPLQWLASEEVVGVEVPVSNPHVPVTTNRCPLPEPAGAEVLGAFRQWAVLIDTAPKDFPEFVRAILGGHRKSTPSGVTPPAVHAARGQIRASILPLIESERCLNQTY